MCRDLEFKPGDIVFEERVNFRIGIVQSSCDGYTEVILNDGRTDSIRNYDLDHFDNIKAKLVNHIKKQLIFDKAKLDLLDSM